MGFFLSDIVNSALTPRGTNAKRGQENQQKMLGDRYAALFDQIAPLVEADIASAKEFQPRKLAALRQLYNRYKPGNESARIAMYRNRAMEQARAAMLEASSRNKRRGLSDAFSAGQDLYASNEAEKASRNYEAQLNDPKYKMSQAAQLLQLLSGGTSVPSLGALGQTASGVYGRPPVQVQPGIGDMLGQLAGAYLGASGGGGKPKAPAEGSELLWSGDPYEGWR